MKVDGRILVAGALGALVAVGAAGRLRGGRSTIPSWVQDSHQEGDELFWLEIDPFFADVYGGWYSGQWDPLYAVVSRVSSGRDLVRASDYGLRYDSDHGEGYFLMVTETELDRIIEVTDEIEAAPEVDPEDGEQEFEETWTTIEAQKLFNANAKSAVRHTLLGTGEVRGIEEFWPRR
jgi:hypothetical protein